ncbi:transcription initiation factor TFIID subunit 2 isoform X2 [Oryza brachyantha]|uniref:transcription initiation factor TFIID subunit 2 isoform X2 n=1 Tax=Oryza brachyantha TaxID=4533 RepID=UPI0007767F1D|nr:transcription initiation factor TFIID subunit 2 isoform X2 [Oryza brachyantha]
MAKARKQKGDEQKPDGGGGSAAGGGGGGGATVLHQKLCLSIDMENRLIYGYTEIKIQAENDTFALHADNMTIRNILVDGQVAEFEYFPQWKNAGDEQSLSSISCSKTAADAACSVYISSLNSEAAPNLIISSERSSKLITEPQNEENSGNHEENGEKHGKNSETHDGNGEKCEENGGKPAQISDDQAVNGCNGSADKKEKEEETEKYNEKEKEQQTETEEEEEKKEKKEKEKVEEEDQEEKEKEKEKEEENLEENGNEKDKENEIEKVKNTKLVHIDYILEKAETGLHFVGNILHSNNQIRRAHCWFPCIDNATQRCPFDLEFTVNMNLVAVSNGDLLYQVLSKEDPPRKTYVYKLSTPVSAQWISLVVGPFEVLPDRNDISVSHMCLSQNLPKLENTISFFHSAYSCYEDYLAASFPFGLYKQVFLPPEMIVSPTSLGASTCIFNSDILHDEKVIDQIIDTRIKIAFALARQWFGIYTSAEEQTDEWLLDGLAGFLTEHFVKRYLGNNEARYRRFKANCTVCEFDVGGATALSSPSASSDLFGTQTIGSYGKIRSLKAVSVLQMLEKQMGPDPFRKILQMIVAPTRGSRTLSTKEFRHLANKVGNLERPFLKEFFPRWVESCGCPVMRLGISYSKRRNLVELAVSRGCTAKVTDPGPDSRMNGDIREGDTGWPGMMSVRVHETDGVYDHPIVPMAGEALQVVEIQCHSKVAAKRFQKTKKGSKPDGSDDIDASNQENRASMDAPLLWIRVDPEMEYLAEIHFHQPVQMWINQLEKDKDVISQSQAIAVMEKSSQLSFAVINALNNFLNDTKAFWRVRVEAAYALAVTASEDTELTGLLHLVKFYKSRRFDADIGLPRPNDFHDIPEYFVLEYNDNNGNVYSDVYWLSAMVQAIGDLEFGQQGVGLLSSLLKRIDRLLQFDSFMPGYNGVLTVSCIRTLARIAQRVSPSICLDRICELIAPFRNMDKPWKVRMEASRVLIDLEFHHKGLDAALLLFLKYANEERSLRGGTKLAVHALRLCQANIEPQDNNQIQLPTLVGLLCLLAGKKAYNNVYLRHNVFCILQIAAGRSPTLHGVPKVVSPPQIVQEISSDNHTKADSSVPQQSRPHEHSTGTPQQSRPQEPSTGTPQQARPPEPSTSTPSVREVLPASGPTKDADNISNCSERRNVVKIRVKRASSSSKADDADHRDHSHGRNENEAGPCSSMSVDAPMTEAPEAVNVSNHNIEEQNSCHDRESRMSASISNVKLIDKHEASKELQCTADSRLDAIPKDHLSPIVNGQEAVDKPCSQLEVVSTSYDGNQAPGSLNGLETKEKKKDKKDKKRNRDKKDDPEYLEKKRLKKEKKRIEKEKGKRQKEKEGEGVSSSEPKNIAKPSDSHGTSSARPPAPMRTAEPQISNVRAPVDTTRTLTTTKIRIKVKPLQR